MGQLFNLDNKFFQWFNKFIDCICLSIIWVVMCIPIITAGAATTAMYYTINKCIMNGRGYVWKEFWHAFASNFKQSTAVWLINLAIYALLGIDCYIMFQFAQAGMSYGKFYIVFIILMCFVTMWVLYLFPYIARFENTVKVILKNTALIAIGNLWKTLLLFLLFAVVAFAVYVFPIAGFILPAGYMVFANLILEKIFKKYMSPEDIAAEEERNRDYMN